MHLHYCDPGDLDEIIYTKRWSHNRCILPMRANDFTAAAEQLLAEMEKLYGLDRSDLKAATIKVYTGRPYSLSTWEGGLDEFVEHNRRMVSHTYTIGDDIPKDVWRKAFYVKASIYVHSRVPRNKRGIMATIEAKGDLPKRLTFFVQGTANNRIQQAMATNAPFTIGEGGSNHY